MLTGLNFDRFSVLTFDCYGTLIDWETGILNAIHPILAVHGHVLSDAQVLKIYGELEPREQNPYQRYRDVLANIVRGFGQKLGFTISDGEAEQLPASLPNWLPFPDTVPALRELKRRFKLAIISNTDDDLFAATARHLQIEFDDVITAEQAKAYKPSAAPFLLALQRLGQPRQQVLHVGQSIYHDVLPAKSLQLSTALVHRRGFGATQAVEGEPDITVPDLKTLAALATRSG
ncbi:MAG: HAD family hydrolase [Acidobacteriaceae bacterium]|nr:HAD family hydrolase [Acidobacteriaceae bacterium]